MEDLGYCIFSSSLHADGVKATRCFEKDDVVFLEKPLHFLQTIPNRRLALACGHCSKFLGSVGLQLKYLQKQVTRDQITKGEMGDFPEFERLSEIVPCSAKCGELYCSESCRHAHWTKKGHSILCTGHIPDEEAEDHPLYQFKMYAVTTNEIFLMIADLFAEICAFCEKQKEQGIDTEEASKLIMSRYQSFVRQRWWDAVQAPKGQKPIKFKNTLKKVVSECWELLSDALKLKERGLDKILSDDYLSRTIGMFEQNNVGVRYSNPIVAFIKKMNADSPELEQITEAAELVSENMDEDCCPDDEFEDAGSEDEEAEELVENEEEQADETADEKAAASKYDQLLEFIQDHGEESIFPPLDGTAFYQMTCKINHSCDPNVIVTYTCTESEGLMAKLTVLKKIEEGEELVQSYIDQNQPLAARRAALVDYGFVCACPKCQEESKI